MVKKRVDPRVKGLIEYNVRKGHRSLFILVGDHGKDQVENLHKILSKARVKARPSVLWCYKKELGFSTHRKKRIKEIKRNQARGLHDPDRDDPFDLFISSTNIRWTYYKETDKILGQTFGMCVLQDFEALTPNLLARTIETVEGGGLIILLLKTVKSLKQLYTLSMDVHSRFRTEAHHEIIPRFNERFILSLSECNSCLVLDDELNILPISSKMEHIPISEGDTHVGIDDADDNNDQGYIDDPALIDLKQSLVDTPNIGQLVSLSKTIDQAQVVMSFLDMISEKMYRATVALTAARGRGKSAAIGLCLAGAISYGFSNIFVTAPSPENLKTVFEFVIGGLKALKYTEHMDFEVLSEHQGDQGKVVVRINVTRTHRQTIQYILPTDHLKLAQAELVAIDEAAAIPLPIVKNLFGPYIVFLSSTVNGYEGTGRALSLKLIQQLRTQQGAAMADAAKAAGHSVIGAKSKKGERQLHEERWKVAAEAAASYAASNQPNVRTLNELTLDTPIRYAAGDPVEKWLNNLLCLDTVNYSNRLVNVMPAPHDCDLYIVNRDALFSYHALSEALLQRIWSLYTSAHYKNSPNDLQMLSDAPAHRLFVLLGPQKASTPVTTTKHSLPDILCVVQIAFEGYISRQSIQSELMKANKASGDMIPWTISQQFNDTEFATLSGARIVRIATHPDVQKMGYGSRVIDLIIKYFQNELSASVGPSPPMGTFGPEGGIDDGSWNEVRNMQAITTLSEDNLLNEEITPSKKLPSLLTPVTNRPCERLHWLGVSFGLTTQLLNFWTRKGFKVCYLRQTTNELTGEFSSILLKELNTDGMIEAPMPGWVESYVTDYRRRLISLMSYSFSRLEAVLAITLLDPDRKLTSSATQSDLRDNSALFIDDHATIANLSSGTGADQLASRLTADELLSVHFSHHDMNRLELYARNMVDHHMILDCVPLLAKLLFSSRLPGLRFSYLQIAILLSTGLQHRDVDSIANELDIPVSQVLAFFNKTIRKIATYLRELVEKKVSKELLAPRQVIQIEKRMSDQINQISITMGSLRDEQNNDVKEFNHQQKKKLKSLDSPDESDLAANVTKSSNANASIKSSDILLRHAIKVDDSTLVETVHRSSKKPDVIPTVISLPVENSTSRNIGNTEGREEPNDEKCKKKKKDRRSTHAST